MTTNAATPPTRPDELARDDHVVCRDLFKIYKIADLEVVALRGLDLTVGRGEVLAIVGASGSGKSTLLNVLAGLDVPSAGTAFVNTRDLLALSEEELVDYRREEVGFVLAADRPQPDPLPLRPAEHRSADDPGRAHPQARPRSARSNCSRRSG